MEDSPSFVRKSPSASPSDKQRSGSQISAERQTSRKWALNPRKSLGAADRLGAASPGVRSPKINGGDHTRAEIGAVPRHAHAIAGPILSPVDRQSPRLAPACDECVLPSLAARRAERIELLSRERARPNCTSSVRGLGRGTPPDCGDPVSRLTR